MKNELYIYACPKMSAEQQNPFNIFAFILCTTLFSSLAAIFGNTVFGIAVTAIYLVLSLLTFIDKDKKSRYMEQVSLCALDVSVIGIYMFSIMFPEQSAAFWSVIFGVGFSVIYEIIFIVKIKKKLYSNPSKSKKLPIISTSATVLVFSLIFSLLNKNPSTQDLAAIVLMLLCGSVILGAVISLQKLVIYLIIRNNIKEDFSDTSDAV